MATGPADLKSSRIIWVLGGPGSGKGTHCGLFSQKSGFCHLSTGELLRKETGQKTPRGKQLKGIMDKGQLVPTDIVLTLLKEEMTKNVGSTKGFLLDGYPRTLDQAQTFEADIAPVEIIVYIQVTDEKMKERMLERAKTSGRSDDNPETITKRLATYHEMTKPVIDYYSKQKRVTKIDASGTIEQTQAKIAKAVKV